MASRTSPPGTDSSPVVDIEDFVVESSVGWRNGSWQASPPVQYRQRDVRGISGGEGVDGPGGGGLELPNVNFSPQCWVSVD